MTDPRLRLDRIRVAAGDRTLLHDVTLELHAGERLALLGASGSGKSLTARALVGLLNVRPGVVSGDLMVELPDGRVILPYRRTGAQRDSAFDAVRGIVAWMPQATTGALDPFRTVRDQLAASAAGDPIPWAGRVGLDEGALDRWPHELSGGMAQRVVLAQCLARGARLLIVDEPTAALDPVARSAVLEDLYDLAEQGVGVLLVTHDLRQALGWADRAVLLHDGRVVEAMPKENLRMAEATSEAGRRLFAAVRAVAPGRA